MRSISKSTKGKTCIILSLFKGNTEPITLLKNGKEVKGFAQASPKRKTVDIYTLSDGKFLKSKMGGTSKSEKMPCELPQQAVNKIRRKGKSLHLIQNVWSIRQ